MMYHLRRNIFPARATYTPPFRSRGMTGNHPLNHTPSTWNVDGGFPQGIFYQTVWNLSNKLVSPTTQKTGSPRTARLSLLSRVSVAERDYLIIFAKFQKSCWYINVFPSHAHFTTQQLLNAYCFVPPPYLEHMTQRHTLHNTLQ